MDTKNNAISDEELEQVAGGMSAVDEAVLNGTVMGHLLNARQEAQKTQNVYLYGIITDLLGMCQNRGYAEIVSGITELLPAGVYDSSDKAAYDSLKKAKETIENSFILNA